MRLDTPRKRATAAALTGLLLILATPPVPLGFLAWIALVPLMISLEQVRNWRESVLMGIITGVIFYTGTIHWVGQNTGASLSAKIGSLLLAIPILSAWLGVVTLLYFALLRVFGRRGHVFAPILWSAHEMVWHYGELAAPWPLIALTQGSYLPILQLASVGGTTLITAWVVAINGLVAAGRERRSTGLIVILMIAITWAGGAARERLVRLESPDNSPATISLIQGNIEAAKKWELGPEYSLDVYVPITYDLARQKPDLIVWPETAAPVLVKRDRFWRSYFRALSDSIQVPLVTGARHYDVIERRREPFNACFLIRPRKQVEPGKRRFDIYSKVHLVPFGERVPFQRWFPSLGKLNLGQAEFRPGPGMVVWEISTAEGSFRAAPLICYEAIFPDLGRKAVEMGADVLLNLTNDGWYNGTSEISQHLLLSRIRAIETGRMLVRATNTGVSAIIGPSGFIFQKLPENTRGALTSEMIPPVRTTYINGGWIIQPGVLIAAAILYLYVLFRLIRDSTPTRRETKE